MRTTRRIAGWEVGLALFAVMATAACGGEDSPRNPLGPARAAGIAQGVVGGAGSAAFRPYGPAIAGGPHHSSRPVCRSGPHRDFDFWLGRYDLDAAGVDQGTNRITGDVHGCLVEEDFVGADGIRGRSFNAYDHVDGTWLQTFVSELNTNFLLTGNREGDQMVMEGARLFPVGGGNYFPVVERVTWTPLAGGVVNQLVELSVDGGTTFPFVTGDIGYLPVPHPRPADPVGTSSCAAPEFHALDAWAGDWTVSLEGRRIGKSTVTIDLSGCVVEERFTGLGSFRMRSLFSYDASTGTWHRTLVDSDGHAFRLEGAAREDGVTLEGFRAIDGPTLAIANTIIPNAAGGATQEWTVEGETVLSLVYESRGAGS